MCDKCGYPDHFAYKRMVTVHFIDVGRGKHCWSQLLGAVTHARMLRAVKERGALASRDVEFVMDDGEQSGTIIVGGFRAVGRFQIEGGAVLRVEPIDLGRGLLK